MQAIDNLFSLKSHPSSEVLPKITEISGYLERSPNTWWTIQAQLRTHIDWKRILSRISPIDAENWYVRELIFTLLYLSWTTPDTQLCLSRSDDPIMKAFIDSDKYYLDTLRLCVADNWEDLSSIPFPIIQSRLADIRAHKRSPSTDLTHHERSQYTPWQISKMISIMVKLWEYAVNNSSLGESQKSHIQDTIISDLQKFLPDFFSYPLLFNSDLEGTRFPGDSTNPRNVVRNNPWQMLQNIEFITTHWSDLDNSGKLKLINLLIGKIGYAQILKKNLSDPITVLELRDAIYNKILELGQILEGTGPLPIIRPSLQRVLPD